MKITFTTILSLTFTIGIFAQCSTVGVQISSSDTTLIQLYNAGIFNIPSGNSNVCVWEVTDFSGTIIHQDTTSGDFEDQSFSLFNHMVPITDSMKATIIITNEVEGITCTMNDTLYWKETEVIPDAFIGNWDVLSNNVGVEEDIVSSLPSNENSINIEVSPSPVFDYFTINGDLESYSIAIINVHGQIISTLNLVNNNEPIDLSNLSGGLYFINFFDQYGKNITLKKIIKL